MQAHIAATVGLLHSKEQFGVAGVFVYKRCQVLYSDLRQRCRVDVYRYATQVFLLHIIKIRHLVYDKVDVAAALISLRQQYLNKDRASNQELAVNLTPVIAKDSELTRAFIIFNGYNAISVAVL